MYFDECRIVYYGMLAGRFVVIGYMRRSATRHVFSMRKANDREKVLRELRYMDLVGPCRIAIRCRCSAPILQNLPVEAAIIDAGLYESNMAAAPLGNVQPITCIARAPSGEVVGGAVGRTWGECAELQQLWVAREHRRSGTGSRLVKLFETRAIARGCQTLYLTTFTFQAPALYESLGYRPAAELRGFPGGIVKYLMVRTVPRHEG